MCISVTGQQTANDAPWTEDPNIKLVHDNVEYIDMYKALDRFELWVGDETSSFPAFDHATLYSRCAVNFTYSLLSTYPVGLSQNNTPL